MGFPGNQGFLPNQVVDRCSSTNDLARALGEAGHPHGTWISARMQEGGRGRRGRKWESVEGNLFLSVLARPASDRYLSWVSLAAGVGIAGELRRLSPLLEVKIKWPNDLWLSGAKVGGILCEKAGRVSGGFLVIGLGINCASAPPGLDQPTASLSGSLGDSWNRTDLAGHVRPRMVEAILVSLKSLEESGPSWVAEEYSRIAVLTPGTRVRWKEEHGQVIGLGAGGELLVRRENGEEIALFSEDVSLKKD